MIRAAARRLGGGTVRRAVPLALCLVLVGMLMPAGVLAADPWTVSANTDLVKADFISSSGSGATLYLENHVSMEPFNIPEAGAVLDAIGFAGGYSQEVSWTNDGTSPTVSCPKGLTDLFSFCHNDVGGGWALIPDGLRTELVLSGSDSGGVSLDVGPSQRSLAYDGTVASIGIALEVLNPSPGIIFENSQHIASLALQLLPEAGAMAAALKRGDGTTAGFEMLSLAKRAAQIIADHITDWAIGRLVAMNPYFTGAGLAIKVSQAAMALANLATHLQAGYLDTSVAVNYAGSGAAVAPPAASGTGLLAPVASGQTLTVLNGYDNPIEPAKPTSGWCASPGANEHDHCNNQQDGLDFVPSDLADMRILAPTGGMIRWAQADKSDPSTSCLALEPTDTTLNLSMCHFQTSAVYVKANDTVAVGTVLGLRNPADPWVHVSLDDRYLSYGAAQAAAPASGYPPVAFDGSYSIEGHAFPTKSPPVAALHCGETITSTNTAAGPHAAKPPAPSYYAPAPTITCSGVTVAPPAPKAAAKPGGMWIEPDDGSDQVGLIHVSAHAYPSSKSDPAIDHVDFTVWWPALGAKSDPWELGCTASAPTSGDTYECDIDPSGFDAPSGEQLWLSFDVYDKAGGSNMSPNGERSVTWDELAKDPTGGGWQTYQGDGYVVDYPGEAVTVPSQSNGVYSMSASYYEIGAQSDPDAVYVVERMTFHAGYLSAYGSDFTSYLKQALSSYAGYTGGVISSPQDVTVDGRPGLEITSQGADGAYADGEILVAGNDMYMIVTGCYPARASVDTATFFASFHLD